jgi:hypothetical protein
MLPRHADEAAAAGLRHVGHAEFHLTVLEAADPHVAFEVVEEVIGDDAAEPGLVAHVPQVIPSFSRKAA